ncbi:hypothetical protein TSUD_409930 [Trifolium subterraneum]|uniref:Protein FAR1-RELATED SEQUENCE n=1 Tax=Trifolium subterraneum TaxID=3900 RepID=A0A2Z6PSQ9_TRISU|nr:hypothetical protein TSUD_409930 [Trifolium subterraneum]
MTDHEMVDMLEHTTTISSDEIHESAIDVIDADPLNDRIPLELPLEPFEGMEFTSIEDVKNYYVRYARNKGPSKIASMLSTESGGVDNVGFSQQDVNNYLKSGFFYAFQMDAFHQSTTIEDFESDWEAMIDKYELQDNQWLKKIYSIRAKWIPSYVRHNFCAGMSTTQRSESMNKFFKDFLNSSTPLSKFVKQYDKALDARYNKEREKNVKTRNSKPLLRTLYPMEEEASKIYTRKVLVGSQIFIAEKVESSVEVSTYKTHEIYKEKPNYYVTFDVISKEAKCSCHMFEFVGILCRHVLNVFIKDNVYSLPSQYVLHRWTINAKKEIFKGIAIEDLQEGSNKTSSTSLFNSIMVESLQVSERGSRSKKHHDIAIQALRKAITELDLSDVEESTEEIVSSTFEVMPNASNNQTINLCDPPFAATKGRPCTLRMKDSLELVKKGSYNCGYCKRKGHNKLSCPSLKRGRYDNINGQLSNSKVKASGMAD